MKKIFALAAIALVLMTSCSGDDDSPNNNSDTVLLKKRVITNEDGFVNTFEYQYDGNRLTKMTMSDDEEEIFNLNYTYSQDKLTKSERFEDSDLIVRTLYSYDGQGRLSESTGYMFHVLESGTYLQKTSYTYNSDGTVSAEILVGEEGNLEHFSDALYKFENGNIIEYTILGSDNVYTFDNKNNPMKNVFAIDVMNLDLRMGGPNNMLSFNGEGQPYTFTYTYNADGYPKTSEQDINGSVFTTQYYY